MSIDLPRTIPPASAGTKDRHRRSGKNLHRLFPDVIPLVIASRFKLKRIYKDTHAYFAIFSGMHARDPN